MNDTSLHDLNSPRRPHSDRAFHLHLYFLIDALVMTNVVMNTSALSRSIALSTHDKQRNEPFDHTVRDLLGDDPKITCHHVFSRHRLLLFDLRAVTLQFRAIFNTCLPLPFHLLQLQGSQEY